jgi:hypothetical protein
MPDIGAHDWFRPRLAALLAEADSAGYGRDVAVAVVTDLVNGAEFNTAPLPNPDEKWAQDIGEPEGQASEMPQGVTLPDEPGDTGRVFGTTPHIRRGWRN